MARNCHLDPHTVAGARRFEATTSLDLLDVAQPRGERFPPTVRDPGDPRFADGSPGSFRLVNSEGATFLRGCQEALVSVRAAEEQVVQAQRAPRGRLRLSLPLILGKLLVLPALTEYKVDRYGVCIEAHCAAR